MEENLCGIPEGKTALAEKIALRNYKLRRPFRMGSEIPAPCVVRSGYASRSGLCTNPRHQGRQVRPVFLPHGPEFESDSRARNRVSHGTIGTDLSFPNEKTQGDNSSLRRSPRCFDKQTT